MLGSGVEPRPPTAPGTDAGLAVATVPPFPHTAHSASLLNRPVIEFDRKHNPLRDDLLQERFVLEGGRLTVPDRPGLGVTVCDDVVASAKMYGEPHRRSVGRCFRDAMNAVGRNQQVVAGTQISLALSVDPEAC